MRAIFALLVCHIGINPYAMAAEFELKDGDRVVWLGSTLIEREQRYGYWEYALTARFPDRNITFRNLAWSGDNVQGEARLRFDLNQPQLGLQRMVELTLAEKPTVILIAYGTVEAFEGKPGLPKFTAGLERLLDRLAPSKARIVLMTPLPQEDLGPPLPQPNSVNAQLQMYRDAIRQVAEKRRLPVADMHEATRKWLADRAGSPNRARLTDNGMHLSEVGYALTAPMLLTTLGVQRGLPRMEIEVGKDGVVTASHAQVKRLPGATLKMEILPEHLPIPGTSAELDAEQVGGWVLKVSGLTPGKHALRVDGKDILEGTAEEWSCGKVIRQGSLNTQALALQNAICEKNQLYFHRWRPQNETYLFGFRKHEQGRNAKEIVEFDPFIARMEKEIARLRKPAAFQVELIPVK